ncbi:hypothetical protein DMA15_12455 [Streptomyces sp. WAC 01529]|uniref:hypothetical protein n=1 Tax=Streptomyces sp. WAC 01529 TaxID=2203205 RepID=UPI000F6DC5F6|nr:hypothetical protein [Streptomyces sp. WAC 01529]AZM53299.1 hypothetical protein DMA15_12455 [Streptomyces sp. WAC 01529]
MDEINTNERSLKMRIAAHTSWANTTDRSARTAAARKASHWTRFLDMAREQHPDATEQQIEQIAESLRKAHFTELALRSAASRRLNGQAKRSQRTARNRAELAQYEADRDPAAA